MSSTEAGETGEVARAETAVVTILRICRTSYPMGCPVQFLQCVHSLHPGGREGAGLEWAPGMSTTPYNSAKCTSKMQINLAHCTTG